MIQPKSEKLKSSKRDQNGILKLTNSTQVAYIKIIFILANRVLKSNLSTKKKITKCRTWWISLIKSDVVLVLSHLSLTGAGEGKASLLSRENTVHQKCVLPHESRDVYILICCDTFCRYPLIHNCTRVSTFESLVRYSRAVLLPSRMRCLCCCSHSPAKTSSAGEALYCHGNWQQFTHHRGTLPGRTGNAMPYLKATFLKDKTHQRKWDPESHICWLK